MSFSVIRTLFVFTAFATESGAANQPMQRATPAIPWSSVVLSANGTVESEQLREIGPLKWQSYRSSLSKSRDHGTVEGLIDAHCAAHTRTHTHTLTHYLSVCLSLACSDSVSLTLPSLAQHAGANDTSIIISVDVTTIRQEVMGFGGAFTEAAGYVFSGLTQSEQERLVEMYWGSTGAGYSTGRIAMNSPDFALCVRPHAYSCLSSSVLLFCTLAKSILMSRVRDVQEDVHV